jgi:hypothetical protein
VVFYQASAIKFIWLMTDKSLWSQPAIVSQLTNANETMGGIIGAHPGSRIPSPAHRLSLPHSQGVCCIQRSYTQVAQQGIRR